MSFVYDPIRVPPPSLGSLLSTCRDCSTKLQEIPCRTMKMIREAKFPADSLERTKIETRCRKCTVASIDFLKAERKDGGRERESEREGPGVYRSGITCTRSDFLPSRGSVVKWTISSRVTTMLPRCRTKRRASDVSSCVPPSCSPTFCLSVALPRYRVII